MKTTIDLPIRRDVPFADQCGHGMKWTETCSECEIAWLEAMLPDAERRVKRDRARLTELLLNRRKHLVMVCGVDCKPGDAVCNNYCNSAPQKGPMAKYPPPGPDAQV